MHEFVTSYFLITFIYFLITYRLYLSHWLAWTNVLKNKRKGWMLRLMVERGGGAL